MVDETIYIRRATTDDARLLSALSAVTFSDTFEGTCTDDDLETFIGVFFNPALIEKELADRNDFYFIAFITGEAAGYMRLKEEVSEVTEIRNHRSIELKRIYVLKKYHSQKVGAKLMTFALEFAAKKNYNLVWLGVWEHNEKAKSFYKKFGFTDTGYKHPFPIGNTPQTDSWFIKFIG